MAIILCAYFGRAPWIFTTSLLFLSLADGGAAVAGKLWGYKNRYFVFGNKALQKSIVGTVAFLLLSYMCIGTGWLIGGQEELSLYPIVVFLVIPLSAMILENVSPYGTDNVLTPLYITLVCNSMLL